MIESLNKLPILEQLKVVAEDQVHVPNFYPTKIADSATIEVISNLGLDHRMKLVRLLKGKQKGPWGKFKKRLLSITEHDWDKRPWDI